MGFRTQRDVDRLALPPGKPEHVEFDEQCRGLAVRMQGGSKVWLVRYQVPGGNRRKLTLGDVSGLTLAEARKRAVQITSGAKDGKDPQQQREHRKRQAADTLGGLFELYLSRYAAREQRPRTLVETTRALRIHLEPLHNRPLGQITRRDVATRLMELVDSSGPIMANRTRAALSHCYAWAMQQGLAELNPVVGTARPAPESKRDRVLSADELRAVWQAAGEDDYGRIVKLLILTAQRREEVGSLRYGEIDSARALWTLPAARSKNGLAHDIPLAPIALTLVGTPGVGRDYVFGRGKAGFSGWSASKVRLDVRVARRGAEMLLGHPLAKGESPAPADALVPWTLHDLRRTAVTGMAEIGVAPHIVEAIVNHISGHKAGVAGVYNRAAYAGEKRSALQRWADHVEALVSAER
ncbi:MAG: site-specific integrase [Geminicoccaceae bacterium]